MALVRVRPKTRRLAQDRRAYKGFSARHPWVVERTFIGRSAEAALKIHIDKPVNGDHTLRGD